MNKTLAAGWILLAGFALAALAAPWLAPADPGEIHLEEALAPPGGGHPLGTDQLGRDLWARMLFGGRVSLTVASVAVLLAVTLGVALGSVAGYAGGWVDLLVMRFTDIMLCFPTLFLILASVAFLEPSLFNLVAIIGATSWMEVARLVRAEILSLKEREFILAARGFGASGARIVGRHLLPNALAPVGVSATLGLGSAVFIESGLSFLGIGIQPPTPSWGNILAEGRATLGVGWWLSLFPGLAIFGLVLGCNLLSEGLRKLHD
ncbi:MAG: ABC transporter permease [Candidatus Omnitrophica bacterium]|nr:ABC transporter permease [Candidatus Omnitrophota bacterium]